MIIWLSLLILGRNGHLEKQMGQAPDHSWLEAQQGLELSSASQQLKEGDGRPACPNGTDREAPCVPRLSP